MVKKYTNKYYFSVEGETEKWYLEWLKDRINELDESRYRVAIDCKVEKNPFRRAKRMTITSKTEIWHLSDYESNDCKRQQPRKRHHNGRHQRDDKGI